MSAQSGSGRGSESLFEGVSTALQTCTYLVDVVEIVIEEKREKKKREEGEENT